MSVVVSAMKIRRCKNRIRKVIVISILLLLLWFIIVISSNDFTFDFNIKNDNTLKLVNSDPKHPITSNAKNSSKAHYGQNEKGDKNATLNELLLIAFNKIGARKKAFTLRLKNLAAALNDSRIRKQFNTTQFLKNMMKVYNSINKRGNGRTNAIHFNSLENAIGDGRKVKVNLATVVCGNRTEELQTMLKSAMLFSQDASLHVIAFTDGTAMIEATRALLEMKWTAMTMGWHMTFEMHEVSFPGVKESARMDTLKVCATQRLFFPSVLNHIDSVIYVDTDILFVSNLTELWMEFGRKMNDEKMVAMAQNSEPKSGYYNNSVTDTPRILPCGANVGVILMNLTRMRELKFEERVIGINTAFKEMIILAGQDIVNILLSVFPKKAATLDCSYNFHWTHCGDHNFVCHDNVTHQNRCFCNAIQTNGVRVIHGNSGSFYSDYKELLFLPQVYKAFQKLDLLTDSYLDVFRKLEKDFKSLQYSPCAPLTAEQLCRNPFRYFNALAKKLE